MNEPTYKLMQGRDMWNRTRSIEGFQVANVSQFSTSQDDKPDQLVFNADGLSLHQDRA